MPLTIKTDIPNTTDATNGEHYALATTMMACGVGELRKGNADDLAKLTVRVLMLDIMPRMNGKKMTVAEFMAWVATFGNAHANVKALSDTAIAKAARANWAEVAKGAIEAHEWAVKAVPSVEVDDDAEARREAIP